MKITLEFDNYEDAQMAMNGHIYSMAIFEFDQYIRSETKYNSDNLSEETYIAYQHLREKLKEILQENNLNIN